MRRNYNRFVGWLHFRVRLFLRQDKNLQTFEAADHIVKRDIVDTVMLAAVRTGNADRSGAGGIKHFTIPEGQFPGGEKKMTAALTPKIMPGNGGFRDFGNSIAIRTDDFHYDFLPDFRIIIYHKGKDFTSETNAKSISGRKYIEKKSFPQLKKNESEVILRRDNNEN